MKGVFTEVFKANIEYSDSSNENELVGNWSLHDLQAYREKGSKQLQPMQFQQLYQQIL